MPEQWPRVILLMFCLFNLQEGLQSDGHYPYDNRASDRSDKNSESGKDSLMDLFL